MAEPSILGRAIFAKRTMAEPSILGRAIFAKRTMAEPSKTHAPFGLRRNLDRGTAPQARPRPGRGAVWPSLRCRQRRPTSVWVFVAAARRYAPTSPAPPRLAYGPPALATRPFVLSPRTAKVVFISQEAQTMIKRVRIAACASLCIFLVFAQCGPARDSTPSDAADRSFRFPTTGV